MWSSKECSLKSSHLTPPTVHSLISLLCLQLQLPHYSGGGGNGGVRGQDGHAGGHSGRDLIRPEAPPDQLEVDCLACVPEHLHCLLIGVSLDVHTIDLQRATICEPVD